MGRQIYSPQGGTLHLWQLPLCALRWSVWWMLPWPWVSGAGEHTACLHTFTLLLQNLLVCNQLLNVSADVKAVFTALHRCVSTMKRQREEFTRREDEARQKTLSNEAPYLKC